VKCFACYISESRKERSAEKCCSPVDAGSPAVTSFFRTKSTVTIFIQFPENASIHLSIQLSSNLVFTHSVFLLPMPSYVQPFIYPSFSLQFIVTSSLFLSSLRPDIRLFAHRLSVSRHIQLPAHSAIHHSAFSPFSLHLSFYLHILISPNQLSVLSPLSA